MLCVQWQSKAFLSTRHFEIQHNLEVFSLVVFAKKAHFATLAEHSSQVQANSSNRWTITALINADSCSALLTPGIVRMFGIKSSMKGIVWWYFSWPACLVRSGKPWLCELGTDHFGSRLDLVTGPQHPLPLTMWTIMQGFPDPISFLIDSSVVKWCSQRAQSAVESEV